MAAAIVQTFRFLFLSSPLFSTGTAQVSEVGSPSDPSLAILDRQLRSILEDVRLVYLLDREGGWDASANWEDMLSLGEQQRLGMVSPIIAEL